MNTKSRKFLYEAFLAGPQTVQPELGGRLGGDPPNDGRGQGAAGGRQAPRHSAGGPAGHQGRPGEGGPAGGQVESPKYVLVFRQLLFCVALFPAYK